MERVKRERWRERRERDGESEEREMEREKRERSSRRAVPGQDTEPQITPDELRVPCSVGVSVCV